MSLLEKQFIFAKNLAKLINWAFDNEIEITLGEVFRTKEQQLLHYKAGRSKVKTSGYHGKRLAIDLNVFIGKEYRKDKIAYKRLGKYWKSLHPDNIWGGDWKSFVDAGHFQMGGK